MMPAKNKKPDARKTAKEYSEAQRQRNASATRKRTSSQMSTRAKDEADATGTKVFTKPNLTSSKGNRTVKQTESITDTSETT